MDELWAYLKNLGELKLSSSSTLPSRAYTSLPPPWSGCKYKKSEVQNIIWEVDDDCDKCLDWEEFKAMFYWVRNDKTGFEPRKM